METNTTDKKKAVGYLRVSTDEQQLGPAAQRAALVAWCERTGAELVDVFTDQGISGGAELDKRPALLAAIAALKTHGACVLLVAKRDRLARDNYVNAMVHRLVARSGATVRSADGSGDGDGPEAVLMQRMVEAFAEYERLLIKARTKAAMAVKRSRGERISREPSYGYRLTVDGRVEACPVEQRVVRQARQYRQAEGLSLRGIGARLRADGLLPRSGGEWNPKTVRALLSAER